MKSPLRNSLAACAAALALVLLAALAQPAAAQEGKTDTEQLLQAELNKFASDKNGWTHLHWAALLDDGKAIQRLADMGAFMDSVDNEYNSDNKFSDKGKRRAQLLGVKNIHTNASTPLHVASRFNKSVAASVLIANGAKVNAKDEDGVTPLHDTALKDAAAVAKLLIAKGAEVNAKSKIGWTPLHSAVFKNAAEVAKVLIDNGAKVNAKSKNGWTPLHVAAKDNAAEVAKLLIDNRADVNAKDKDGDTPLHRAAARNAAEVAKLLIDNRAALNAKGKNDRTPLHMAASNNAAEVAKLLIDNGAEVNAEATIQRKYDDGTAAGQESGWTPLDWAIWGGHSAMQSLLRQHGGRCNKRC